MKEWSRKAEPTGGDRRHMQSYAAKEKSDLFAHMGEQGCKIVEESYGVIRTIMKYAQSITE